MQDYIEGAEKSRGIQQVYLPSGQGWEKAVWQCDCTFHNDDRQDTDCCHFRKMRSRGCS